MRALALLLLASTVALSCGGESEGGGSGGSGGAGGSGGSGASTTGGAGGTSSGGAGGSTTGGAAGSGGSTTGGAAGSGGSATGGAAGSGGSATGGAAGSGGSATGGAAGSGGSATGGAAGSGGSSTGGAGGTGGAATALPECKADSDCKVFEDCCSCEGVPKGENPPICKMACTEKKCTALGVSPTSVSCVAGRCVKGFDCDSSKVLCLSMPPKCDPGKVPQVKGSCWSGDCVPATECTNVADCAACTAAKTACVSYVAQLGPVHHCVDIPLPCTVASCACFGPSVCIGAFNACSEKSGVMGVTCGCPTC